MKNCSLVISTYNWPEALNVCLLSVMNQSHLPSEIIIADDGSDERTKEVIEAYQKIDKVEIVHIWHPDDGFRLSTIRNKAIAKARYSYIVQIDGDIVLNRHFIQDHLAVAEEQCFIRGTRSHITQPFVQETLKQRKINFRFYSKGVKNRFNALRIPFLSWIVTKKKLSGKNIKGCNMAFWKKDFIEVNGYNNALTGWGHEDEELATRMVNKGVQKKSVKLRCVQFHIFHPLATRNDEHVHNSTLSQLRASGAAWCEDGLDSL